MVGARPQFIKAAAVSRALQACSGVTELLIHTGQHYDDSMSEVFFRTLDIPKPTEELGIGSGQHGDQTGRMLAAVESVLATQRPDVLLVYGDTNSTLAGALAAAKMHIPVAHVEAGLRSFNRRMPEEINRVLTDHLSEVLFAPTAHAVKNLAREGIHGASVHQVGDVMYDAALYYAKRAKAESRILVELQLADKAFALATMHRAETTDCLDNLRAAVDALDALSQDLPVVFPMHPRTTAALGQHSELRRKLERVRVLEPVGYLDMIQLERNARLIVTDSGGVQKEAYFFRVPCVTIRRETEWVELVETGWNRLAPPDSGRAIHAVMIEALCGEPGQDVSLYGTGNSAIDIASILQKKYC